MIMSMLTIIAIYGMGIVLVHWHFARTRSLCRIAGLGKHANGGADSEHYLLISDDNQHQIEWILRSLLLHSWIKGKDIRISVLDQGSSDDTIDIVRHFCVREAVNLLPEGQDGRAQYERMRHQATVIKLNCPEDLRKIPSFFSGVKHTLNL